MTQKQLAERAEISIPFLSEVENNKRNPGSEILLRLADALRASLDYLMRGEQTASAEERKPVLIPPELAEAAEEYGWSYGDTAALAEARAMVLARRGGMMKRGSGVREWGKEDWVDLHGRLFDGKSED